MAEKNSLWKNIRNKAAKNRRTGDKPKEPTKEMLRQEAKIKARKYAEGGLTGDDEDPFKSKLNQGQTVGKTSQDWLANWVQDSEFANRLNQNFPAPASDLEKKIYGNKEARERASAINLKNINKRIPDVVSDIYDTNFLYNPNPESNTGLLNTYRNRLEDPKSIRDFDKNMSTNPQGFTDQDGRIIITNQANTQYGPESVGVHELTHKVSEGDKTLDRLFRGKFQTPSPDKIDNNYNKDEMYPFLMQMRMDNKFQPGEEITPERLKQIRESGPKNHLFRYYNDDEISKYLNTLASNQTQAPIQYAAKGGYMYAEGGPIGDDEKNKRSNDVLTQQTDKLLDKTAEYIDDAKSNIYSALNSSADYLFNDTSVSPFIKAKAKSPEAKQYYFYNYPPVEYPGYYGAAKPIVKSIGNTILEGDPSLTINRKIGYDKQGDYDVAEEAWRKTLGLPIKHKYIIKSKYKPTISSEDSEYYTLNPDIIDKQRIIDYVKSEDFNKESKPGKLPNTRVANIEGFSRFMKDDFMPIDEFEQIDPLQNFQVHKAWDPEKKQWYAAIYDNYDFSFKPAQEILEPFEIYDRAYYLSDEKPIKYNTPNYQSPKEINRIKQTPRDATNTNSRIVPTPQTSRQVQPSLNQVIRNYGNPYMYYAGGPMYYGDGGKIWKHIGAGAYGILEGGLDTLTFGATDQLTDKGFDWLTKVGNKNLDLNDPKNAKFLRTQQQIRGYSNVAGAIGTAAFTGQWGSAIGQSAKGVNTAFQATEGLSDDFKKWSNIGSQAIGIGAGLAGGNLNSAQSASKIGQAATKFGSQASKVAPYANQAMGMLGNSGQPLWQQAEARQEYLNSPEYLAMKEQQNQAYVNQGLSFAANGGPVNNNLLTLQTDSMRNRYKTYKTKYSRGGKVQDNAEEKLEYFGMTKVPNHSGFHYENPNGGSYGGKNASFEKNEIVLHAKGGPTPGPGKFVFPSEVNGQQNRPAFLEIDENGIPKPLNMTIAQFVEREAVKGSPLRKNNNLGKERVDMANQQAMDMVAYYDQLDQQQAQQKQMMVGGALQYVAAGGKINGDIEKILNDDIQSYVEADNYYAYGGYLPKNKNFNMPNSYAKGGSIHIKESKKGTFTAAAKKRGKSVQEFARDVLRNKGNYSAAMVKKANFAKNAAGWKHAEGGNITPDNPGFNALPKYVQAKIMSNMAVGGPLYGNTDSEYTYAHGGPVVSNVNQDFDLYAQNRGGMMMANGGNMYAVGGGPGDELDPEQLKAQGYVEYDNYFYNPTTGQYVDKPSISFPGEAENQKNRIERFMQPNFQINEKDIKPLLGLLANTGIYEMPINTGKTTSFGGVKKPGMENVIGPDSFVDGTRRIEPYLSFNEGVDTYPGKYNLQYVDPYTLEGNEMMNERYPILDREGNIQTTPEDFARLQSFGSSGRDEYNLKKFNKNYNQVMSTRDKVRRAYQNKSPYLNDVVDKPAKPNTYLNNLNTPNVVDNQGNTSSILSRMNKNQSTPIQPIGGMQSQNFQQLPTDNTMPGITGNVEPMPGLSDYASMQEFSDQFTPEDIQYGNYLDKGKPSPMTGPVVSQDVQLTPEETAALQYQQKYSQPGQFTADLIDNQSNKAGFENLYKSTPTTIVQPSQSDVTPTIFPQTGASSTKSFNQPNQPNQGLTGLDYASMGMQALPYFYQTAVGLKGADPVNYQRVTGEKIDPTVAIALSAEEARRAQDSSAYLMRQNAPTSGSYMNNLRNLSLQSGKQRGALAGGLRYQADIANTQMQNELNKVNAGISMQEQIDRLQEKDAARTNITEGLSGLGSTTANVIRDYRTNQINQTIAKNIGTNNYKYDPVNQTITYADQSGKMVTIPAQTVISPNVAANVGTGQIQQPGTSQFETGFDNRLNESFANRFRGSNAGK